MGRLHSPRMPQEKKAMVSIPYLENPRKGHRKSELTWWHTMIVVNMVKVCKCMGYQLLNCNSIFVWSVALLNLVGKVVQHLGGPTFPTLSWPKTFTLRVLENYFQEGVTCWTPSMFFLSIHFSSIFNGSLQTLFSILTYTFPSSISQIPMTEVAICHGHSCAAGRGDGSTVYCTWQVSGAFSSFCHSCFPKGITGCSNSF